ncbi:MAG: M20/M25/M40 family metallo-hydrolase [Phycisphaeraceae bacterium]|nr:M20/M25/M40 family metallo-hydrolase [Phycisphaeraceae bacterium]
MNIDLLKRLCETPGIPGREERVRELIESEIEGLFDDIAIDGMGSLICTRDPRAPRRGASKKKTTSRRSSSSTDADPTRIALLCHMDEIGFYVSHIDDKGFIRVNPAGGFDTRNLFSRRMLVCTKNHGDIHAVMNPGGRPIHIATEEDKKKVPEVKEFMIDTGLPAAQVKKMVRIGDMVVTNEPFLEMGDKLVSKCLDNRIACWLGIEAVRAIEQSGVGHKAQINVVFTTQEEVGLRGALTSSFAIMPDIAIGVDTTLSCDTPGVPSEETVTIQGQGVALGVMDGYMIADHTLTDELEAVGDKKGIPTQRSILPRGGQDGGAAQRTGVGCRAAALLVGLRYIHTVTEMAHKRDLKAGLDLLTAWLPGVK